MRITIDWKFAPDWAKFVVMNMDGSWFWFEFEPKYSSKTGFWSTGFYDASGRNEKVKFPPAEHSKFTRG